MGAAAPHRQQPCALLRDSSGGFWPVLATSCGRPASEEEKEEEEEEEDKEPPPGYAWLDHNCFFVFLSEGERPRPYI